MRVRALLFLSFASACGGPDARSMEVEFDLLGAACEDAARCGEHVLGTAVVAKTGSATEDGFITDSGLPLIHAEADTRSSSVAIIEIVIPGSGSDAPHVRYHELVRGRLTYEGIATNVTEAALDANDWSAGGTFAFDADGAKRSGDVRRIRNGRVGVGLNERAPSSRKLERTSIDLRQVSGDHGRREREDGYGDVLASIDDLARFGDAVSDEAPPPVASEPVAVPDPGPSDSPPSNGGSSDSGGGGCSGDSSSPSSSDSSGSSCGGSSSDSSGSSCDSCGGGSSSDGASSCGGAGDAGSSCGGGGCSGDAAPTNGQKVTRAAAGTARFMWPVGIAGFFNRCGRAISRRRRRSPSANRGSPATGDRR
jgi:hypothetical protein